MRDSQRQGAAFVSEHGEISAYKVMASGWRVGLGGSHGGAMEEGEAVVNG